MSPSRRAADGFDLTGGYPNEVSVQEFGAAAAHAAANQCDTPSDADLYKEVLSALPVGIALQDEGGSFLLANDAAAAVTAACPPPPAPGFASQDTLCPAETLRRARLEASRSTRPVATEFTVGTNGTARTFLTTYQAVIIGGQKRLVSATLDITDRKHAERRFGDRARLASKRPLDLEQRLRSAVRERRFRPAFQPKVSVDSGKIVGFEALARWVDEDGTVHLPGTFIGLATEIGLLNDITGQILEHVTASAAELKRRHGSDVSVSLNVNARQVEDRTFFHAFLGQLADSGIADSIVLELTEDALVATHRFQHTVLPTLRGLGLRVSIDDFGTGYSSLATLADITADEVKVDRAFISSIHTRSRSQGILRAIESLCSALDIAMVAEGVETEEELAYLRAHSSIQSAQGYYFGKPQSIEDLRRAT